MTTGGQIKDGANIGAGIANIASMAECQALCAHNVACLAAIYEADLDLCYQRSQVLGWQNYPNYDFSEKVDCRDGIPKKRKINLTHSFLLLLI